MVAFRKGIYIWHRGKGGIKGHLYGPIAFSVLFGSTSNVNSMSLPQHLFLCSH